MKVLVTEGEPAKVAVTVLAPDDAPTINVFEAVPVESTAEVAAPRLPPPAVTAQLMVAEPVTEFP